jgi:hypothetical protein
MDPYSPEGELINIHSAFHAGAYQQVLDFDTSNFSSSNALPVRVLQLRSQIALGQAQAVSNELASEKTPDLIAVKLLADYEQSKDVLSQAKKLAEQHGQDNLTVQLCVGMILERAGETEAALNVLSKHQGSLDAVALIVQIHLQQNRTDLAAKEAQRARKWAQDSLLVNIAESWVGMREVCSPVRPLLLGLPLISHSGRREVPICILRLRRASHELSIHLPTLPRRTGRIRTPPRPPPGSRSRSTTSAFHRRHFCRHTRQPHRP